jgi:hypothetical protein
LSVIEQVGLPGHDDEVGLPFVDALPEIEKVVRSGLVGLNQIIQSKFRLFPLKLQSTLAEYVIIDKQKLDDRSHRTRISNKLHLHFPSSSKQPNMIQYKMTKKSG